MQPATLAQLTDLAGRVRTGPVVSPLAPLAFAVAIGAAALVLCAPPATRPWRHRRARRTRCVHCGRGSTQGAPPLLIFRDAGRWCADCIRSTDRPAAVGRSPLITPEIIAVDDRDSQQSIRAMPRGADRTEEVHCRAAA